MIFKERSWVFDVPECVTFQQLVDQKKIIQHEIFTGMTRQVLRTIFKEVTLPGYSRVAHCLKQIDIFSQEFCFKNKEVKFHEEMTIEKRVAVEKIEDVIFRANKICLLRKQKSPQWVIFRIILLQIPVSQLEFFIFTQTSIVQRSKKNFALENPRINFWLERNNIETFNL